MQPPILQWKVVLALLAVAITGASLGSALHSNGHIYGVNVPPKIKLTTVAAGHFDCGNVKAEIRGTAPALRPYLRRDLRRICRSRH